MVFTSSLYALIGLSWKKVELTQAGLFSPDRGPIRLDTYGRL